ncbi:MAG: FAD-dependent oxidoreductase [Bacteroidota bacterium]
MYDFLIIGGGAFGLSTAISLAKKRYKVGLLNPDSIPHHLAASTDISKIVRMEYGTDEGYFKMAEICIERWHEWNDLFDERVYHEVGCLMLSKAPFDHSNSRFEKASYDQLTQNGYPSQRLNNGQLSQRFPVFNETIYANASFNPRAGFVESSLAIEKMATYARQLGVHTHEGQTAIELVIKNNTVQSVKTLEGQQFTAGTVVVAAGAHTPYLIPDLEPYLRATGHPVFWLKPTNPLQFRADKLPVFFADIANSGWYGFPLSAKKGVVKIARHADGLVLHPDKDDRQVQADEMAEMRRFLSESMPTLADAPLVYTRRCLYTDTLDGHFWIDYHPTVRGLAVSSGGSGHGMKMAPILGEITTDMLEGVSNPFLERFRWRHLEAGTLGGEEARAKKRK